MPHAITTMFQTLEREETLSARVTERLEALIVARELRPGARLPAERELAAQFGVSRTVVREAVRALAAKGMLAVRPGSGTLVRSPSALDVTRSMALYLRGAEEEFDQRKVSEVRRLLEVEIAGLAAERRTEADLAGMEALLEDTKGIERDRERFVAWDMAFHAALAAATKNEMFSILLDSVVSTMRRVREYGFNVPSTPERARQYHRRILQRVKQGNREAARAEMDAHLREAERTMQEGMERGMEQDLEPGRKKKR